MAFTRYGTFSCAAGLFLVVVSFASNGGEQKKLERAARGFIVTEVTDTDNIRARGVVSERKATLRMANVMPFAKWPKELTNEQQKVKKEGIAFLSARLKGKRLTVNGIDKGAVFHGDLILGEAESFTPGAPSTFGWGIVHLNLMLIEKGYSIYQKDPPDLYFSELNPGEKRADRDTLYKDAEAYAAKRKAGIWKNEEFPKKLKDLAKTPAKEK